MLSAEVETEKDTAITIARNKWVESSINRDRSAELTVQLW
jgi:hypothetical protein